MHWYHELPQMLENVTKWHKEGKLDYVYDETTQPFEEVPIGFRRLFDGKNFGKNIIKLV